MDIKVLKKCIVGEVQKPRQVGEVVRDVAESEAKALCTVGYAKEVKGEAKAKTDTDDASKGDATENANKGNAPKNKAK